MKFSAALVSVAVLLAGSVQAAHVNNNHRRHNSPSGVYKPGPAPTTTVSTPSVVYSLSQNVQNKIR